MYYSKNEVRVKSLYDVRFEGLRLLNVENTTYYILDVIC